MDLQNIDKDLYAQELKELESWIKKYHSINPIRALPTHLVSINLLPDKSSFDKRLIFSKITLWLFAVDDIFDSQNTPIFDLEEVMKLIVDLNILNVSKSTLKEELKNPTREFIEILNQLDIKKESIYLTIKEIISYTLEGMIEENRTKDSETTLSLETYLKKSKYSIGTPLALYILFIQYNEINTFNRNELKKILEIAGEITRLLNDIRSYEKELKEGKVNSIGIIEIQLGNLAKSKEYITKLIEKKFAELENYNPSLFAKLALNLCFITKEFYTNNDFHKYSLKKLNV